MSKRDPDRDLIWLFIFIVAWILLIVQAMFQERFIYALCLFYGFASVVLKRLSFLFGFGLHPFVKWGYTLIGIVLLLMQIGYKDFVTFTQVANVIFILLGCWGIWSIQKTG